VAVVMIQSFFRGYAVRRFVRIRVRSTAKASTGASVGLASMSCAAGRFSQRRCSVRVPTGIEESFDVDNFNFQRGRVVTHGNFANEARIAPWVGEITQTPLLNRGGDSRPLQRQQSPASEEFSGPLPLMGHLLKKSPGAMFHSYQKRFFVLRDGNLYWWRSQKDAELLGTSGCRGTVDFTQVRCGVNQKRRPTKFGIAPVSGSWGNARLTGAEDGRILEFDTAGSEHGVTRWLNALSDHIDWAHQQAQNQQWKA